MFYLTESGQNPEQLHNLVQKIFFQNLGVFPIFTNSNLTTWTKNRGRLQFCIIPEIMDYKVPETKEDVESEEDQLEGEYESEDFMSE